MAISNEERSHTELRLLSREGVEWQLFLTGNSVTDRTEWASAGLKFCDSLTHIQVVFRMLWTNAN